MKTCYWSIFIFSLFLLVRVSFLNNNLTNHSDPALLWFQGNITYKFLDSSSTGRSYSNSEKNIIKKTMKTIESQLTLGCITFTEITQERECTQCLSFDKKTLECKASIGMRDVSFVTLGHPDCFDDNGATVLHELIHVLGAIHEQNRPDRDKYVEIVEDDVADEAVDVFKIRENRFGQTFKEFNTVYDFYSVMHYPETRGCKPNKICIKIKEPYRNNCCSIKSNINF